MKRYRVSISGLRGSYTEYWQAESKEDAERKAIRRWQREFGDAGAYRFSASEDPGRPTDEEEDDR